MDSYVNHRLPKIFCLKYNRPLSASSADHSAPAAIFKKIYTKETTKENISELMSEKKLILKSPWKADEVIKQFSSNKNDMEVVSLSSSDLDEMLFAGKGSKDISRIQ